MPHDAKTLSLAELRKRFEVPGQTALALKEKLARVRAILVSSLPDATVEALGMAPARSLEHALRCARGFLQGPPGVAVVLPRGSETLPQAPGVP